MLHIMIGGGLQWHLWLSKKIRSCSYQIFNTKPSSPLRLFYFRVGSYHLTLLTIQHCQFDSCSIKFFFQLKRYFLPHKTLETLLYFNHPTWIRFTSTSISPSFYTMEWRNFITEYDLQNFYLEDRLFLLLLKLHLILYRKEFFFTLHVFFNFFLSM